MSKKHLMNLPGSPLNKNKYGNNETKLITVAASCLNHSIDDSCLDVNEDFDSNSGVESM